MKQCNHCGAFIDDNAQFCTSCGAQCPTPNVQQPLQEDKDNKKWYYVGGAISLLVLLAIGGLYLFMHQNQEFQQGTDVSAPVSDTFKVEVEQNSIDGQKDELANGYEEKFAGGHIRFFQDGLWGLKDDFGRVSISPRYVNIWYDYPVIIGEYENGKYDLISGNQIAFEMPLDLINKQGQYSEVVMNGQHYLYFCASGYKLGPVKVWKQEGNTVICRLNNSELHFCNDLGTNRRTLEHPICIRNTEDNEQYIICMSDPDTYTVYNMKGVSQLRINSVKWETILRECMTHENGGNPFFDATYTYNKSLRDILNEI